MVVFFAGIDWADDHHDVVVLGPGGKLVSQFRVQHSVLGLRRLAEQLKQVAGPAEVACIIETRHGILVNHLLESGFAVFPVNPKTVDRHRSPARAKTDMIDAGILARHGMHELDRLRRLTPDSPVIQELKLLTRDQAALVRQQTRLVNQLTACLKDYYPLALQVFCKLNQPITLDFLQAFPTLDDLHRAGPDVLAAFFKGRRHPKPNQTMQRILLLLQEPQLRSNQFVTRAKARLMLAIVAQLAPLGDAIRAYDTEIERLFLAHSDSTLFQSLPGAGKRLAPRLLAEWGDDRDRYASNEGVAALAGTSPVPFQSGRMVRARKRFACIKSFRDALYKLAWQTTLYEPWAAEHYSLKRREGKSHSEAVRALSNTWVRIIHAMWIRRQPYCRDVFLAAQARHRQVA
jgi:transposase